jgi:hypothetical protein
MKYRLEKNEGPKNNPSPWFKHNIDVESCKGRYEVTKVAN